VEIKKPAETGEGGALTAERRYEVACQSAGSRPPALITWHKGKRLLKRITVSTLGYFSIGLIYHNHIPFVLFSSSSIFPYQYRFYRRSTQRELCESRNVKHIILCLNIHVLCVSSPPVPLIL
jgi:hypothetical protein